MAGRLVAGRVGQLWNLHGARRTLFSAVRPLSAAAAAPSSSSSSTTKNVKLDITSDGIAIVKLDMADSKVNTLNVNMSGEVVEVFQRLESDPKVKAIVLMSAKDDFVVGADINMFTACKTSQEMENIARPAQAMFKAMSNGKPKVAAIHGNCLGGGLELALACHYRVATQSEKTALALPEVMLGILPGAGGTQRLPALIGLKDALPLILTGARVNVTKAKRLKLVDEVVDIHALEHSAVAAARELASGKLVVDRAPKGLVANLTKKVLEETRFGQNFIFKKAREGVMKQTKGNYPAPLKIIDVLETSAHFGFGSDAGYDAEAQAFGELGVTSASKALVSLYFGQTACKKNPYSAPKQSPKVIGVLGAGLMGSGITQVSIDKGYQVLLKDAALPGLARGLGLIEKNLNADVKKKKISGFDRDVKMSRVTPLTDNDANWQSFFKKTDIIIEAVFEKLELKHDIIRQFEAIIPPHAVFASNTSAIPISKLATASKRPENFVGMHYFSPVEKMQLLEIIPTKNTSKDTLAVAYEVGLKQGKIPIVVKDVPGFFVNRCLGPYSDEGLALLLDGASPEAVDKALTQFGFPVGPMALSDEVGIDVAASVGKNLKGDLGVRIGAGDAQLLDTVLASGMLGRKSGKGMFIYPPGKGKKTPNPEMLEILQKFRAGRKQTNPSVEDMQWRMTSRFINEAALCLQDEIIANPVVGDIASVFGIGFPPFRGGPFRMVDSIGVQSFVDRMLRYRDQLGPHFEPAPILKEYAKTNKKFHSS